MMSGIASIAQKRLILIKQETFNRAMELETNPKEDNLQF